MATEGEKDTTSKSSVVRPYNSYNIYFTLERFRLLMSKKKDLPNAAVLLNAKDYLPPSKISFNGYDGITMPPLPPRYEHLESVLPANWYAPGKHIHAKRKHTATHGLISFTEIARAAGTNWRTLDKSTKDYVEDVAALQKKQYHKLKEAENLKLAESIVQNQQIPTSLYATTQYEHFMDMGKGANPNRNANQYGHGISKLAELRLSNYDIIEQADRYYRRLVEEKNRLELFHTPYTQYSYLSENRGSNDRAGLLNERAASEGVSRAKFPPAILSDTSDSGDAFSVDPRLNRERRFLSESAGQSQPQNWPYPLEKQYPYSQLLSQEGRNLARAQLKAQVMHSMKESLKNYGSSNRSSIQAVPECTASSSFKACDGDEIVVAGSVLTEETNTSTQNCYTPPVARIGTSPHDSKEDSEDDDVGAIVYSSSHTAQSRATLTLLAGIAPKIGYDSQARAMLMKGEDKAE